MSPRISVIVLNYNGRAWLEPCLSALVAQAEAPSFEVILADNGSPWYVSGAPNAGWDDDDLHDLGRITGADFEVVDTRRLRNGR